MGHETKPREDFVFTLIKVHIHKCTERIGFTHI